MPLIRGRTNLGVFMIASSIYDLYLGEKFIIDYDDFERREDFLNM